MALTEFERKRCELLVEAFLERRGPLQHVRGKLDLGFRVADQSVVIFEIRPRRKQPDSVREDPVAKATFVRGSTTR